MGIRAPTLYPTLQSALLLHGHWDPCDTTDNFGMLECVNTETKCGSNNHMCNHNKSVFDFRTQQQGQQYVEGDIENVYKLCIKCV